MPTVFSFKPAEDFSFLFLTQLSPPGGITTNINWRPRMKNFYIPLTARDVYDSLLWRLKFLIGVSLCVCDLIGCG